MTDAADASGRSRRFEAAINPYGCAPSVVEAMVAHARTRDYRFYGDADAGALRQRLGALHGIPAAAFSVWNGSGEAFVWHCVGRLLMGRGRFLCPRPSYERFVDVGRRTAVEVAEVSLAADYSFSAEAFVEAGRRAGAGLAMISSPNNPTGNILLDEGALNAVLDGLPECLIVVDEAYAEYAGVTFAPLTQSRPNLVVLKSFSKAYGLAGLRVGYAVAHPSVTARFASMRIPWAVDSMALAAAEAALADQTYLADVVARIRRDMTAFGAGLAAIPGLRPLPSAANFFLVETRRRDATALAGALAERGMRVRTRLDMPHHVRITSMLPEDNAALLTALAESARSAGAPAL